MSNTGRVNVNAMHMIYLEFTRLIRGFWTLLSLAFSLGNPSVGRKVRVTCKTDTS